MRFAFFPAHVSKVLRLPRKSEARSYEVLHLSRKIILANLKISCSKMQPPLRKSPPWSPNTSNSSVSCTCACHAKCIFADPLQMSHACHRFWKCYKTLTFCLLSHRFWKCYKTLTFCLLSATCRIPCACHAKPHLNLQKWPDHVVFLTFWLGNVLRATAASTFSTSQLPKVLGSCDVLAPFQHLNFQRCSGAAVFCTCWRQNVLRATTACAFSTSKLPNP